MSHVIAKVRLAPGQVGFYDELTRIHLTISNPEKFILSGMNVTNIKRGVHSGRLRLMSGSLEPEKKAIIKDINVPKVAPKVETPVQPVVEAVAPKAEVVETKPVEEVKAEPVASTEVKNEEVVETLEVIEVAEQVEAEEASTEEGAKKASAKKSSKKK